MNITRHYPSLEHEEGVEVLQDLAIMMDFSVPFVTLPDGSRPDVYFLNPATKGIFVGEAKATERPTCLETKIRFTNYVRWLSISKAQVSSSVCAICFGNVDETPQWEKFLVDVLGKFRIVPLRFTTCCFENHVGLVYSQLRI